MGENIIALKKLLDRLERRAVAYSNILEDVVNKKESTLDLALKYERLSASLYELNYLKNKLKALITELDRRKTDRRSN